MPPRDRARAPGRPRAAGPARARAAEPQPKPDVEARALLDEARAAFAAGDLHGARRAAIEAKKAAPRLAAAREALGMASFALEQWHEAAQELLAFRRFSGDRRADAMIARARTNEGRPDKAIELLADLRREDVSDGTWADAEIARAHAHAARGNTVLAQRVLAAAATAARTKDARAKLTQALRDLT